MEKTITRNNPVVLLDLQRSYRAPFLVEEARKQDWRFFNLDNSKRYIPKGFRIVGAITDSLPDDPICMNLRAMKVPVVRMGKLPHRQDDLQPAVLPDLYTAGIMAAEHYASRGFKHIGYMGNIPWGHAEALYAGFLMKGKELGLELHLGRKKQFINIPTEFKNGSKKRDFLRNFRDMEVKKWLEKIPKPVGILGYNYGLCADIDLLCNLLGISVPGEVSILCYNDVPECTMSYTQLSAIDIGLKNIAKKGIDLLCDMIDGNPYSEPRFFVPPSGIILRQSTNILAVSDPVVAKALTFMWENLSNPISVSDIADASGIPLRSLNRSFKKCLNRTMTEELLRKRLEKACDLLRKDSMTVEDIAKTVGFDSKAYFYKRFKEAYQMTPVDFKLNQP